MTSAITNQKRVSGREDIGYSWWHYPPAFLLIAAGLAVLPIGALLAYRPATLGRIWWWCGPGASRAWLLALAFPGVFVNVTHGHNGVLLGRAAGARPAAAAGGALRPPSRSSGCWCRWCWLYRGAVTIAAAAATVLVIAALLVALSAPMFSSPSTPPMTQKMEGAPGFYKIQSVYAALRQLGVPETRPTRRR